MKAITCLQPHKLQKWIRSPSDDRRLMEALLAAYRARSMSARKARPVEFSDGSEQAVAKHSSSSKSDTDSDGRRGEKRKKKAKRQRLQQG